MFRSYIISLSFNSSSARQVSLSLDYRGGHSGGRGQITCAQPTGESGFDPHLSGTIDVPYPQEANGS